MERRDGGERGRVEHLAQARAQRGAGPERLVVRRDGREAFPVVLRGEAGIVGQQARQVESAGQELRRAAFHSAPAGRPDSEPPAPMTGMTRPCRSAFASSA